MEKLDTLVVVDPFPTVSAVLHDRTDGVYLLPATTQFETRGSVTASNRSLQWREQVVAPLFESKTDHQIIAMFARKFGFADRLFRNINMEDEITPEIESVTREFNRGMWTVGYTGQSPERIKLHMANQHTFDRTTLRANGGPADGDYYGMPWPCWGTPEMKHPGTPNLYDLSRRVSEGGLTFRARFGVERDGDNLLAEGVYSAGSEIEDGYPEFTYQMLVDLGWDSDLTDAEKRAIGEVVGIQKEAMQATGDTSPGGADQADNEEVGEQAMSPFPSDFDAKASAVNWKTDLSGGIQRVAIKHECAPFGNAKARAVVWTFPDPVPVHREPLYSNRRDLVADYPTYEDRKFYRLPTMYASIQKQDFSKDFPIILTSGRLVEYEGGGDESRSNPWLAELQQDMFVEINPRDANDLGVRDGVQVWVEGPESGRVKVMAMVTERVAPGVAFMPFHFGGHYQGEDLRSKYPEGADPIVLGESCNTAQTYGYDSVTQMQETKATLCKIVAA
jgi:formate dehydrogenase major subunit